MPRPPRIRRSGVYIIRCAKTGYAYIGSATDLEAREKHQRHRYREGRGHNKVLQFAWNLFGESNFTWWVIEECGVGKLHERETYHLDRHEGPLFNLLSDARRPPKASLETRRKLSEKAKRQHTTGQFGRYSRNKETS